MRYLLLAAVLLLGCPTPIPPVDAGDPCGGCRGYILRDSSVSLPPDQICPIVWERFPECGPGHDDQ